MVGVTNHFTLSRGFMIEEIKTPLITDRIEKFTVDISPGVKLTFAADPDYQEVDVLLNGKDILSLNGLPVVETLIKVLKKVEEVLGK